MTHDGTWSPTSLKVAVRKLVLQRVVGHRVYAAMMFLNTIRVLGV
jgi:hypothetical protein